MPVKEAFLCVSNSHETKFDNNQSSWRQDFFNAGIFYQLIAINKTFYVSSIVKATARCFRKFTEHFWPIRKEMVSSAHNK